MIWEGRNNSWRREDQELNKKEQSSSNPLIKKYLLYNNPELGNDLLPNIKIKSSDKKLVCKEQKIIKLQETVHAEKYSINAVQ